MTPEEVKRIYVGALESIHWEDDNEYDRDVMRLCVEYAKNRMFVAEMQGENEIRDSWQSLLTKIKEEK